MSTVLPDTWRRATAAAAAAPWPERSGAESLVAESGRRRVRHEVRDGVTVAAFSAAASTVLALALLLVVRVAGQTP